MAERRPGPISQVVSDHGEIAQPVVADQGPGQLVGGAEPEGGIGRRPAYGWDHPQEGRLITVDVCTPPRLVDGVWTYEDLELDPVGNATGFLELVDVDEFDAAVAQGWMSPDEAEAAQDAADQVEKAMRGLEEPFGRAGWLRLAQAIDLDLAPL